MKRPERWQEVKEILYPALGMAAAERSSFLDQKCGDDKDLRQEIESLLAAHSNAADLFESPAVEKIAAVVSREGADGFIGRTLGHYEIVDKLGAGGMGEVYLARDTLLDRKVALKFLPAFFTQHPDRLQRFQQEARAASALNHPNILTIHEVGNLDSAHYIATEFVDGESLRDRMRRAPLKITEALDIATQVASALATAHDAGIIHRDIKPENIMLRRDGIVKVVDFGLAKLTLRPTSESEASTMVNTDEGIVMGTAQYMSPEQARGTKVDVRTDIWSLGCVLYEMLAGRSPFEASTTGDVIVSVLEREPPPLTRFAPEIPSQLDWMVQKALRKERDERYQTGREILSDLRSLRHRLDVEAEIERTGSPDLRVTGLAAQPSDPQHATETIGHAVAHPTSSAEYIVTEIKRHKVGSILALITVAIAVIAAVVFYPRGAPALTEKDDILLADITNSTGDPVFDGTLKQALAVNLGQSPFLNIISENRVREALRRMERPPDERITPEVGLEICQRENIKALLTGSIASLGGNYVITLEAQISQTGEAFAREQVEAAGKEQVIGKLGEAATKLREKLGESIGSIQKFDTPLAAVTTSSLEALKAYTLGRELAGKGKDAEAIPFLRHAVELDRNFALAYHALAIAYSNPPAQPRTAEQYGTKAFELRERVTERERFVISSTYYRLVTREVDKAIEVLELWSQTYPRDPPAHNNLALTYAEIGRYEKALASATEGLRINPNVSVLYGNLAWAYMALGRFAEARTTLDQARARDLHSFNTHYTLFLIAFAEGEHGEMQRELEWAKGKPFEPQFLAIQSWTEMYGGRYREASQTARRAAEMAKNSGLMNIAAESSADLAAWGAITGNCPQARSDTANALAMAKGSELPPVVALAPALCGDTSRAQTILDDLSRSKPKSTDINVIWGPLARAAIEIDRGNPAEAVRILEKSRQYEMGWGSGYWHSYVRGLTYLRQGSAIEAMSEFQKIIDRRGIWPAGVQFPLAHLGVARAAALAGDTAKSRKAYEGFFELWKDADRDIPVLLEARREYEKLTQ